MIYLFDDESGNFGSLDMKAGSEGLSISMIICDDENIDEIQKKIENLRSKIKKEEIKFKKLSNKERKLVFEEFRQMRIKFYSVYRVKTKQYVFELFLKDLYESLCINAHINKFRSKKVTIFYDGIENGRLRKYLEYVLEKYLIKYSLKFGDSLKFPLLQAADFYAGLSRYLKRNISSDDDIDLKELE
jgi:hypothetical protein